MINTNQPIKDNHQKISRVILLSSGFGLIFGAITALSFYMLNDTFRNNIPFYFTITFLAGLISGIAGIGGYFLENFLIRLGMVDKAWRQVIIFLVLATLTQGGAIIFISGTLGGISGPYRQFLWVGMMGCCFGAVLSIVEYRFGEIRAKMIRLELENKYLAELTAKDRQLQEITQDLAVSEERNRMARELHDSISQGIHGIIFAVHSLKNGLPRGNLKLHTIAGHLEETANATLSELRAMILELKPSLLGERGLAEALKLHADLFARRQQLQLEIQIENIVGLTSDQERAIFRITQEALTNIGRHAGASQVRLTMEKKPPNQVVLVICDNGQGFDQQKVIPGNGFKNMTVRSREAGGNLWVNSEIGKGTRIEVILNL